MKTARLLSGLTLGIFLTTHFVNLGMGLRSASAMDGARPFLTGLWSNPLGACVLYGAFLVHVALALLALYRRRSLAMSAREIWQFVFGLLFPFLLVPHIVGTQIVPMLTGRRLPFAHEVYTLWVTAPDMAGRQLAALIVGWLHCCLGVWFWLHFKSWFRRIAPFALTLALLIPLGAVVGVMEAGREVARAPPAAYVIEAAASDRAAAISVALYLGLSGVAASVLIARGVRDRLARGSRFSVTYPSGQVVTVGAGFTILEASRFGRVPHLSVCGGRGRCSTCRVRIVGHQGMLPPADAAERATLDRSNSGPGVRLACRLRPTHDLTVYPVLATACPQSKATGTRSVVEAATGTERQLAILFCDLRSFTRRTERLLPYDTVFILSHYHHVVGSAVERSAGYLDKFIGDGALALFGLQADDPREACRQALKAAALIAHGLDDLNAHLGAELSGPLRIAIGLHFGPAVVGHLGYGQAMSLTAVGDGINVASRLEGVAKDFDVEAAISTALIDAASIEVAEDRRTMAVAGRSAPVEAVLVQQARDLEHYLC